jgi:hypothetical protein
MVIGGELWVDGVATSGEVVAYIMGVECGRGESLSTDGSPVFAVSVASDSDIPGCGMPGSPVELTIGGRRMNQPIPWQPGPQQPLALFAGPLVARYLGLIKFELRFDESDVWPQRVVPYISGVECGVQTNPMQGNGEVGFQVVVLPEELRPGCGREGVLVTLQLEARVRGAQTVVTLHEVLWQPGPRVQLPELQLNSELQEELPEAGDDSDE